MAPANQADERDVGRRVAMRGRLVQGRHWGRCLLGLCTVVLVILSFPPYDLEPAAWVALVPWLVLVAVSSPRGAALGSLGVGLAVNVVLVSWLRHVTIAGWLALAFYLSLYYLAFGVIVRWARARRRWPLALLVPVAWTALEYLRSILFTGFPWFLLGHTQYRNLPFVQIADVTGVYGVTFALGMVNGFVADVVLQRLGRGARKDALKVPLSAGPRPLLVRGCAAGLLVALLYAYGFIRLGECVLSPGPKVCLVQGNIPQSLKNSPREGDAARVLQLHLDLSMQARGRDVDLLVWPETSMPAIPAAAAAVRQMARGIGSHLLIGSIGYEREPKRIFNSAYYFSPEARFLGRYDKIHPVVFGEYTPLAEYLPFLKRLRPAIMGPDLSPGMYRSPFVLARPGKPARRFVVTICYEDTEPRVARRLIRGGADFMVNVTNDGWFPSDAEVAQHLAICTFRAIENRVPIARCANTGISAFIRPTGAIQSRLLVRGRYRGDDVQGILTDTLQMGNQAGLYTRIGDVFALLNLALFAGGAAFLAFKELRRRRSETASKGRDGRLEHGS